MNVNVFNRVIGKSQAKFIIKKDEQIVSPNDSNQQCSYNLPVEFFEYALKNNILVKTNIQHEVNRPNDEAYILSEDYQLELAPGIIWLIGEEYKKKNNTFLLLKSSSNNKIQLFRVVYDRLSANDESYSWYVKLYDRNLVGNHLRIEIDEQNKKIHLDILWTALQNIVENQKEIDEHLTSKINFNTSLDVDKERNRIIFGAPGTGKSFKLNIECQDLLKNASGEYERVTFHPDYSYANFVGTYKPVTVNNCNNVDSKTKNILNILKDETKNNQEKYDDLYNLFKDEKSISRIPILLGITSDEEFQTKSKDSTYSTNTVERNHGKALRKFVKFIDNDTNNSISYEYVPGPFMRMYVKALKNAQTENPRPFILMIEEINRANVAAVFGDIFQLLDRNDDNISEYPIQASEDVKKYLAKEFNRDPEDFAQIRIPNNLFIWATMNSADQGVFPMDTAFKRRWDFTYLGIDKNANEIAEQSVYLDLNNGSQIKVFWNGIRVAINEYLAKIGINEDKQLGPYFLKKDVISDSKKFREAFKNKIIMYLFEDAVKQKRASVFSGVEKENLRYSKICEAFDKSGIEIFNKEIQDKCKAYDPAYFIARNTEES